MPLLKKNVEPRGGVRLRHWPVGAALGLVRFYQIVLSPVKNVLLGPYGACRFYPTCSTYACQCLRRHGLLKGGWLTLGRLLRCQPLHPGGVDLPPETFALRRIRRRQIAPAAAVSAGVKEGPNGLSGE